MALYITIKVDSSRGFPPGYVVPVGEEASVKIMGEKFTTAEGYIVNLEVK